MTEEKDLGLLNHIMTETEQGDEAMAKANTVLGGMV